VRAHVAAYYRYSFSDPRSPTGGGQVQYGQIWWGRAGKFNGSQSQFWQAGDVRDGAHTVRYDFRLEVYRATSSGWECRDVARNIVPDYPNCTRDRARRPTWYHYRTPGHDYHQDIWFKLRDCAVGKPDTSDGTWYSPRHTTKTYHCVDCTGDCYFKGY
jgi:hypothetical protein